MPPYATRMMQRDGRGAFLCDGLAAGAICPLRDRCAHNLARGLPRPALAYRAPAFDGATCGNHTPAEDAAAAVAIIKRRLTDEPRDDHA